jgi:hypothetical protein
MASSLPTPRDVAERVAVRSSECAGALTAFCLFILTWVTGYAWMYDAPLDEASARRDEPGDSNPAQGDASLRRGPLADRRLSIENQARFQSATWRGKSFFTRATSERFLTDEAVPGRARVGSVPIGQPQPLSLGQAQPTRSVPSLPAVDAANSEFHRDFNLPSPQIPVPPEWAIGIAVPGTAYGVIQNLTPPPGPAGEE